MRQIIEDSESDEDALAEPLGLVEEVGSVKGVYQPPILVSLHLDSMEVSMKVDTGVSLSVMSDKQCNKLWPGRSLKPTSVRLETYSKEPLKVMGSLDVKVGYEQQEVKLPLIIVKGNGLTLLGRDWLKVIKLNWSRINCTRAPALHELIENYAEIFQSGLGTFKGPDVAIEADPEATPRFCKARQLPYAMRNIVEKELDRLVSEGTLEKVEYADWAAPIVAVLKKDKKAVRICGDFRMTVNPVSKLMRYPIPKIEDLFATLSKGKLFTKLDLAQAYQQLKLNAKANELVVINTHKGLFRYTRLPFGISSAPGIFQKVMEDLLRGIRGVLVYIDDILISSESETEHLQALEEVFKRLATAGLRAKKSKCKFMSPRVNFWVMLLIKMEFDHCLRKFVLFSKHHGR